MLPMNRMQQNICVGLVSAPSGSYFRPCQLAFSTHTGLVPMLKQTVNRTCSYVAELLLVPELCSVLEQLLQRWRLQFHPQKEVETYCRQL